MGLEKINKYIAQQFSNPKGIRGIISTFVMNNMNKKQYGSIIENLKINSGDKVLDIGFGNGKLLNKISKQVDGEFYGLENIKYTDYGFNRYTVDELRKITVESGFEIVKLIEISKDKSYCLISKKV
ncbi:hypothetical protein [uncultured Clostridium sp.]|uniref:hypothetical protein n=1 Tax=uncultured Clostridium sp. TaxID=59620 RepID=UPI002603A50A|nr:hypothetical protein [uncultured Clostridium sp.]